VEKFEPFRVVNKPWGSESWLALNDKYCLKAIRINKGYVTSLQYHEDKRETSYIHEGRALVTLKRKNAKEYSTYEVGPGTVLDLPVGDIHRIEALEDVLLFEASTPEVDDVVRLEDSYGREGTSEA
jgi:mannose-6-phosphate isomerase-like protein (cupin superfamily)